MDLDAKRRCCAFSGEGRLSRQVQRRYSVPPPARKHTPLRGDTGYKAGTALVWCNGFPRRAHLHYPLEVTYEANDNCLLFCSLLDLRCFCIHTGAKRKQTAATGRTET